MSTQSGAEAVAAAEGDRYTMCKGLGFRFQGLGFRIRVEGLGSRVLGLGFRVVWASPPARRAPWPAGTARDPT